MKVPVGPLRDRISRARSMDLRKLTDKQVDDRLGRIMDGYSTMRQLLQTNMVFRARPNSGEVPFQNATELWYPPAAYVSRGRFNDANESMFYVSNRFRSALFEMRPKVGDTFTVLAASRRPPYREIVCASVGMQRCLAAEAANGSRGWLMDHPTMQGLLAIKGFASRWLPIDQYLGDICVADCPDGEQEWRYKPTNALARLFARIPDADALQYPSVAMHLKGINLCMTPAKADELFKPAEAFMVQIVDYRDELPGEPPSALGYFALRFIARTSPIHDDGLLVWRQTQGEVLPSYISNEPVFF